MARILLRSITAPILALTSIPCRPLAAQAAEGDGRPFAGVGFNGAKNSIRSDFPRLQMADSASAAVGKPLSGMAVASLSTAGAAQKWRLATDIVSALGSGAVFAFTLDDLSVERFRVRGEDQYKIVLQLAGDLMVVDFSGAKTITRAVPATVEYVDVRASPPATEDLALVARSLLAASDSVSLFVQAAHALKTAAGEVVGRCRLQVTGIDVDSLVTWRSTSGEGATDPIRRWIAAELARGWIESSGLPFIPYAGTEAIDGRLALRFADATALELELPLPDFALTLEQIRVRRIEQSGNSVGRTIVYGVVGRLRVRDTETWTAVVDLDVRYATAKTIPNLQETVDDWGAIREVVRGLVRGLPRALVEGDRTWLLPRIVGGNIERSIQNLSDLRKRCGAT